MATHLQLWSDEEFTSNIPKIFDDITSDSRIVAHVEDTYEFLRTLPSEFTQLIITSPPYNVGKEYETRVKINEYLHMQKKVIKELIRILEMRSVRYLHIAFDGTMCIPPIITSL